VDSPALAKAVREVNPESATFEGEGADNVELLTVKTPKPSVVSPFASSSYVSSEPPSNIGIDFRLTKVLDVLKNAESAETLSLVLESNAVRGDVFYIENGRVSSLYITDLETLKTVLRLMRDRLRPLYLRESSGSNFRFEEFARAVHKAVLGEAIHPDKIDGKAVKKISYFELPYALGPDPVFKKAVKRTKKPKDGRRPKKAPASEKAPLMPPIPEAAKSQDSSAINVENLDGFFRNNWKVREVVGVLKNPKSAETLSILLESDAKKGHVFYLLSNEIRSFYIDDFGILKVVLGLVGAQSRPLFRTAEDGVHSQIDEFARAVQKAMLGKAEYPVKIEDKHVKKIPYTELPYILVPVKWTP
jgi:hypothetical protein